MSLDLYQRETSERLSRMDLTDQPEVTAFDGFVRGTGQTAMQTFAKHGRSVSLAAATPILAAEAFTGGTELSDRFFKMHEEVFQNAVDRWTPRPGEVGVAGQITGQLLATLPMVIASPGTAAGMTGLATAEDLSLKGVDPTKATATGMVQAAGLGLGIWMPVIGQTLAQRVLLGGAAFNVAQGVTTRAASELILEGTPAAEDFKAFDPTALTLDVMLGAAFGGIVHMSPTARAQGEKFWQQMDGWSKNLKPSDVDALAVLRQAQHLNADSLPGKPVDDLSLDSHVQRARHAVDQLARDQKVDVSDMPEGKFEIDEARMQEMSARADQLVQAAEVVRKAERLPKVPETEAPPARVSAEPPPPRGEGERPGGAEATEVDPIVLEARSFIKERGDMQVTMGRDADGNLVTKKLKSMLGKPMDVEEGERLFHAAAACMLGGA